MGNLILLFEGVYVSEIKPNSRFSSSNHCVFGWSIRRPSDACVVSFIDEVAEGKN